MTVSNVSSTVNPYQPDVQSPWKQRAQDFKALQSALQSGDLSGAQQAFAAFQKDMPASAQAAQTAQANSASTPNSQGAKDFQALQSALGSGDLSGAQQAFASLQKDLQSAGSTGRRHHHHGDSASNATQSAQGSSSSSSQKSSQGAQDLQALQTALTSGDLSGAQQAFAALKQDLQASGQAGHHHHRHSGSVNGTTQAASSTSSAAATQTVGSTLDVQA
jgi:ribosomal protein S20